MDVDYYDLAWHGYSREELEGLFAKCAEAEVEGMFFSVIAGGYAEYPSRILPLYDGGDRRLGSKNVAQTLRKFDSLGAAVELGKKYGIKILAYFRMFDDFWPGMGNPEWDAIDGWWWESRCGLYRLKGWPCYSNPRVREYKLSLVREIAGYGVDGFMFGLTRSHSLYQTPYRQPHFFGYNKEIADEYLRRYGVDIRKFNYCVEDGTCDGYFAKKGIPFINEVKYVGAAEFDLVQWHRLKGEGAVEFLRQVRTMLGPESYIAAEASPYACPPVADPDDPIPAKIFLYPAEMAKEGIINEWVAADNWRGRDFEKELLTNFQNVTEAGAEINLWINDIFSLTGGDGREPIGLPDIEKYLARFFESKLTCATLHEADFLEQHPRAKEIWGMIKSFRR